MGPLLPGVGGSSSSVSSRCCKAPVRWLQWWLSGLWRCNFGWVLTEVSKDTGAFVQQAKLPWLLKMKVMWHVETSGSQLHGVSSSSPSSSIQRFGSVCDHCWLEVTIRKVLRPATSTQVFLSFPVSISKCWDGSQHSKLPRHSSHVALQTEI